MTSFLSTLELTTAVATTTIENMMPRQIQRGRDLPTSAEEDVVDTGTAVAVGTSVVVVGVVAVGNDDPVLMSLGGTFIFQVIGGVTSL